MLFRTPCSYFVVVWAKEPVNESDVSSVPAELLTSRRHLVLAAHRACRALKAGKSISKYFKYEMLACVTGIREISKLKELKGDRWAVVKMCKDPDDCLSWLLRKLILLNVVDETYGPSEESLCTDNRDAIAMERGALLELER